MIFKKTFNLTIIGLFLILFTGSCEQKNNHASKIEIKKFVKKTSNEPINIFENWNIWKRNGGYVFDYSDGTHRLLIVNEDKEKTLFKEIFPQQDSIFYPLSEIENRSEGYPFSVTHFADKVFLFKKLNIDQIISITNQSLIMFVAENYTIIYSQKKQDIRKLDRFNQYLKYDSYWYYYLKE